MAYLSLYRKYRPQTFAEILGQDHVATTLANAIREDRLAHAYLFTGPRGTGKTSTARILAKALNCVEGPTPTPCGKCGPCVAITAGTSLDVIEMDAASHSKVDETREALAGVPLVTAGSRKKVYVIDEVHMLSASSFNALLKTLEEPPPHVLFILATTEAHKVLPTIVSRTQRFDFRRVPVDILTKHLEHVAELEGIDIEADALAAVARHADGGVRDALSILDQLGNLEGRTSELDVEILLGGRTERAYHEVFDAISGGDLGALFRSLHDLVAAGADPRQLAFGALEHARALLLLRSAPDAGTLLEQGGDDLVALEAQAQEFSTDALLRILDLVSKAVTEMRTAPNHRLLLEVALVRATAPETDLGATGLQGRIERLERRVGIEGPVKVAPTPEQGSARPAQPAEPEPSRQPARPAQPAQPESSAERRPRPAEAKRPAEPQAGVKPESGAKPTPAAQEVPAGTQPMEQGAPEDAGPKPQPREMPADVGLGHVRAAWDATLQEVGRKSKRIQALLNPSRPLTLSDGRLVVEVQSTFHEATMAEERNTATLADALHSALGIKPALAFVAKGSPPPPAGTGAGPGADPGTPAPERVPAAPEKAEDAADIEDTVAIEDGRDDPVELIKKGLGAEVVEEGAPK